ncbi:SDR family oxidoreductase [Paracoccus beibuensis]|uniref:SDR family oxidoreductase n=1 Tax=Paracoccus beibuensis TaxID=547602 RepID=UPI002240171E|nr:SDR family oxidoreductase [Paracoccus beibuensis]
MHHAQSPRVVVITGASSGIGEATAEAFAAERAILVLAARDLDATEAVARRCRAKGAAALAVQVDIAEIDHVRALAEAACDFGGGIDVWVSNPGVGAVGRYDQVPMEAHERVIRTNLIGHMNEAHAALPIFRAQGQGVFVNVISLGGFASTPFAAAYGASKFGLRGFSEALRGELQDQPGIHVCDIYPSFVDTPGIGHGANYTGRRLSAPPPLLDARRVARAICRVADRPRATTMVGAVTALVRVGHAISPQLSTHLMGGFLRGYFARAPRSAISDGNLHEPPRIAGGIDGGLRTSGNDVTKTMVRLAVFGGATVLLGRMLTRSDRGRRR